MTRKFHIHHIKVEKAIILLLLLNLMIQFVSSFTAHDINQKKDVDIALESPVNSAQD